MTTAIGGQAEIGDGLFLGGALGWEASQLPGRRQPPGRRRQLPRCGLAEARAGPLDADRRRRPRLGRLRQQPRDRGRRYPRDRDRLAGRLQRRPARPRRLPDPARHLVCRAGGRRRPRLRPARRLHRERRRATSTWRSTRRDTVVLTGTPWLKLGRRVDFAQGGNLDAYVSAGVSLSTGEDFDTTARFADAPSGAGDFTDPARQPGRHRPPLGRRRPLRHRPRPPPPAVRRQLRRRPDRQRRPDPPQLLLLTRGATAPRSVFGVFARLRLHSNTSMSGAVPAACGPRLDTLVDQLRIIRGRLPPTPGCSGRPVA